MFLLYCILLLNVSSFDNIKKVYQVEFNSAEICFTCCLISGNVLQRTPVQRRNVSFAGLC